MKPKYTDVLTKEVLEYYINQNLSAKEISKILNIQNRWTIPRYIKKFGLKRKKSKYHNDPSGILTKEFLIENYINQKKSIHDITKEIGITHTTILRYLEKNNISRRNITDFTPKALASFKKNYCGELSRKHWNRIKFNAKKRNFIVEISQEYAWDIFLKQNGKCALSGIPLVFPNIGGKQTDQTASLDRIDSSLGYIEGNVQWVHKRLQYLKMNSNQKEFIEWCKIVADYQRSVEK